MKLQKNILVIAGLAVLAVAANAQVTGRSFTYSATNAVAQDYSSAGTVTLNNTTMVTVDPYLYIAGNFGSAWTVDGWGTGVDTKKEVVKFYHNETLTFSLQGFANPAKISGTQTGAQAVSLSGEIVLFNDASNASLYDSGMVPAANLNTTFSPSGPGFNPTTTGGVLRAEFSKQLSIDPTVGPGVYENVGTITITRN